ncbi:MAG: PHP domain-containing protein [Ktedonobacterales bacterium]
MELSTAGLVLAPDAAIDLQMHTTFSDGTWTLEQLLDHVAGEQFGLVAITDHDRLDTAATIQRLAREKRVAVLPAVEISAWWKEEPVDVLCYGFASEDNELRVVADDNARRQRENTLEVCANLRGKGIVVPEGDALEALLEEPSTQQPHTLAAFLRQHGIGTGEPSAGKLMTDAGFAWATTDIAAVVEAAHRSRAVCLIAHPGRDGYVRFDDTLLDELRRSVPIDGFEAYYPAHTDEQTAMYVAYADRHGLLTSSGSDSHGPEKKPIKYRADLSRRLLERLGIQIGRG